MRKSIPAAALLILLAALPWSAHAQQRVEIFGGYSYARIAIPAQQGYSLCPGTNCPLSYSNSGANANLNGWEASGAYRFSRVLSVAADVGGDYGTAILHSSLTVNNSNLVSDKVHLFTSLFGPQVSLPGRISPFAQVLVGTAHQSPSSTAFPYSPQSYPFGNSFAAAFGGGLDLKLAPHLWLRPIQFRELLTRFDSNTQFQPEIAAGIVLHL